MKKAANTSKNLKTLKNLRQVMADLRGNPGCPWDTKQTPESLTGFAVEETLELEDAILYKTRDDVMEELGDVLFQVIFQAQMAEEAGDFTLDDVIDHLSRKMVIRHPHVFHADGTPLTAEEQKKVLKDPSISGMWEKNKNVNLSGREIFNIPKTFSGLLAAVKIGKKTRTIDFDWPNLNETFRHFLSEVQELGDALQDGSSVEHQEEELGDVLFTLAQVARHMKADPEKALRSANHKIVERIHEMHRVSGLSWDEFVSLSPKEKDALWEGNKKSVVSQAKSKSIAGAPRTKTVKVKSKSAKKSGTNDATLSSKIGIAKSTSKSIKKKVKLASKAKKKKR